MEMNRERFIDLAIEQGVPEHTAGALARYIFDGLPPGGFLTAVLSNNLMEAFGQADNINSAHMKEITSFIYNEIPAACWGSLKKMEEWMYTHK